MKLVRHLSLLPFGLSLSAALVGADREPKREAATYKVTTSQSGSTTLIKVETNGAVSNRYQAYEIPENVTFDLTGAHIAAGPDHPLRVPFTAGEQERPPKTIRVIGGVVNGGIPREWGWFLTHSFGGAGFYTVATGLQSIEGARIHNVEDGWHPRETPSFKIRGYPNTGRFLMRGCYVTGVRDDCIENDEFIPGAIEDSLFDGVWTLYSEQNERQAGTMRPKLETIGADEDPCIKLTRVLVRVTSTCGNEPKPGRWFKLIGRESPVHKLAITDCVFATDAEPRSGWRVLNFPKDATFHGTNYVLWLGKPGEYRAEVPVSVKFLEGEAAKNKWNEVRNQWLETHGYSPRSPSDWDPMTAPVAPRVGCGVLWRNEMAPEVCFRRADSPQNWDASNSAPRIGFVVNHADAMSPSVLVPKICQRFVRKYVSALFWTKLAASYCTF